MCATNKMWCVLFLLPKTGHSGEVCFWTDVRMSSFCVCIPQLAETQDGESAFGSDSSSVLEWKPPETLSVKPARPRPIPAQSTPTIRKALSALNVQVRETERWLRTGMSTVNCKNSPSFKLSHNSQLHLQHCVVLYI